MHGDAVDPQDDVEISINRRYFNPAGNEQRGFRETTVLNLDVGDQYRVPGAPARYRDVACADVGLSAGADVIGEGPGLFTATDSGTHLVCYQKTTGPPHGDGGPGPPDQEDVLDEVDVRDDDPGVDEAPQVIQDVLDNQISGSDPAGPQPGDTVINGPLATTGANIALTLLMATLLIVAGLTLLRAKRS